MLNQPFFQITLPLMITFVASIWAASWSQNKRIDDMRDSINQRLNAMEHSINQRLSAIEAILTRIEAKLDEHERRITTLESSKWR